MEVQSENTQNGIEYVPDEGEKALAVFTIYYRDDAWLLGQLKPKDVFSEPLKKKRTKVSELSTTLSSPAMARLRKVDFGSSPLKSTSHLNPSHLMSSELECNDPPSQLMSELECGPVSIDSHQDLDIPMVQDAVSNDQEVVTHEVSLRQMVQDIVCNVALLDRSNAIQEALQREDDCEMVTKETNLIRRVRVPVIFKDVDTIYRGRIHVDQEESVSDLQTRLNRLYTLLSGQSKSMVAQVLLPSREWVPLSNDISLLSIEAKMNESIQV